MLICFTVPEVHCPLNGILLLFNFFHFFHSFHVSSHCLRSSARQLIVIKSFGECFLLYSLPKRQTFVTFAIFAQAKFTYKNQLKQNTNEMETTKKKNLKNSKTSRKLIKHLIEIWFETKFQSWNSNAWSELRITVGFEWVIPVINLDRLWFYPRAYSLRIPRWWSSRPSNNWITISFSMLKENSTGDSNQSICTQGFILVKLIKRSARHQMTTAHLIVVYFRYSGAIAYEIP